jgi:hypothetical protein
MRKLRIGIVVVASLLALLLLIAVFVDFNAPGLGQRILDQAGADAGIELAAEGFVFNVFGGIRLEGVEARTEIPSGTVTTTVDTVVLEHRLVPLLLGEIVVDRLVMESPVIVVSTTDAASITASRPSPRFESEMSAARGQFGWRAVPVAMRMQAENATDDAQRANGRPVTVHAASITDGTLLLHAAGDTTPSTRVAGLEVEINELVVDPDAGPIAIGLSATGYLEIGEVTFADRRATGNRAVLAAEAGVYTIERLTLTSPEGHVSLDSLVVDLRQDPYTYRTTLSGDDLDFNELLGIADESALGVVQVEMTASGAGPETGNIVGNGTVRLAAGKIPDHPILEQANQYLTVPLAGQAYEATTIDFDIVDDRVEITPFEVVSEGLKLSADGQIHLDGPLALSARISVPRDTLDLGSLQDRLEGIVEALTGEDGWVSIPVLVRGTTEEPRVLPDTAALFAALRESGVSVGELMQALINRNQ